jgi:uncharacterized membrane protein YeaQ/YmgE (transglycosylase-associated protein family)
MQIFWTIIVGFFVGIVAKLIMPGRDPRGFWITSLLGIGGALLARYIGVAMGFYERTDRVGFIASVLGAVFLLAIYHFVARRLRPAQNHPSLPPE